MVSNLLSKLNSQLEALRSSEAAKKGGIGFLATTGSILLDQLLEKSVFSCPEVNYKVYGLMFMVIPAILIGLTVFYITSAFFIEGFHGCTKTNIPKVRLLKQFIKILGISVFPSAVYIAVCLLRKEYYVCLRIGPKDEKNADAYDYFSGQSQKWGWIVTGVTIAVMFFIIFAIHCFCTRPDPEPDFPEGQTYEKLEAMAAAQSYQNWLKEEAEKNGVAEVEKSFKKGEALLRQSTKDSTFDPTELIGKARSAMLETYPRGDGDLSEPFRKEGLKTCSFGQAECSTQTTV